MKDFFKRTFIYMAVIFLILNIIHISIEIIHDYTFTPQIAKAAEEMAITGIAPEDTMRILAAYYVAGRGNNITIQLSLFVLSFIYGIAYNLLSFEKKSKFKLVLYYLLGLLIVSVLPSLRFFNDNFFKEILYYLKHTYIWYTLIFLVIYAIRIFILRKKTKDLNEIISERNK